MKWGLLGYGGIAPRFQKSLQEAEGESLVAIATRSNTESAARNNPGLKVYDNYSDFCCDPEIEIVYISTTHNFHREHTLLALSNGKHVLCEKPLGVTEQEVKDMFDAAKQQNRFLMEGMWTRFLPAYASAIRAIRRGAIGSPRFIQADFSFTGKTDPDKRHLNPDLAGGGLLDVGVYPIALANDVFEGEPETVMAAEQVTKTGVDGLTSMLFTYLGNRSAQLNGGVQIQMENSARIFGETGRIELPLFWMAQSYTLERGDNNERFALPFVSTGFYHEIRAASDSIQNGLLECPGFSREDSLRSARTVDRVKAFLNSHND